MSDVPHHPETLYQCNGVTLACDSFGDKSHPPVLLVMGLATQLIHWDEQFCRQLAAQGYWVIRFDNRDIGKSEHLHHLKLPNLIKLAGKHFFNTQFTPPYSLQDMADDAIALMDTLRIPKAHVVGVSMGGMISQLIAIHYPERVQSLTSIMSAPGDKKLLKPTPRMSLFMMKPPPANRTQHIAHTINMWRLLHGKHYPFEEERVHRIVTTSLKRGFSPKGVMRQLSAIVSAEDRTQKLTQLKLPSLIFHGENDPLVPVANGIAMAQSIPGAKLTIVKGMGHTIPTPVWPQIVDEFQNMVGGMR